MTIEDKIQEKVILAPYTSFKIGGPADFFVEIKTKEEIIAVIRWAKEKNIKIFILGKGTNIIVPDKRVAGLVIRMDNDEISVKGERLECGAGANLIAAARIAGSKSLTGIEWAISIPGSVGGALFGNAGAYDLSFSEILETAEIYDMQKNSFYSVSRRDCEFGYRTSIFSKNNNLLIWSLILKLKTGQSAAIGMQMEKNLTQRQSSQPRLPSAGCIFKNIKFAKLSRENSELAQAAEEMGIVKNGKIGAGWLIDRMGLKGKIIGGAKISLEHANFIVNTGSAKADDVIILINYVKTKARNKYGVFLQEEVRYFG
jgi:UDP-N-acetylmuramate dehydrogenase